MTLATHIAIADPVPAGDLFAYCRTLLGAEAAKFTDEPGSLSNQLGQGFAAWVHVEYGGDGPLIDEWADDSEKPRWPEPVLLEVTFDTGYGYQAENGAHCGDLHAWLVVEVGRWLDQHRARYYWQHEETGAWFEGRVDVAKRGDVELGRLSGATL